MIITIAHSKGGVGKSTLAWHLAHSFEEVGKTVKIIDIDFQQTLYFVNKFGGGEPSMTVLQADDVSSYYKIIDARHVDDIYVVDIGGFDSDVNRAAIASADKVLIPLSDSVTEVLGFKTFEAIISELAPQADMHVVLNNIHASKRSFDDIKEAVGDGFRVLDTVVRSRKIYRSTMTTGNNVFGQFDEKPKREIRGVRDELLKD